MVSVLGLSRELCGLWRGGNEAPPTGAALTQHQPVGVKCSCGPSPPSVARSDFSRDVGNLDGYIKSPNFQVSPANANIFKTQCKLEFCDPDKTVSTN